MHVLREREGGMVSGASYVKQVMKSRGGKRNEGRVILFFGLTLSARTLWQKTKKTHLPDALCVGGKAVVDANTSFLPQQ